VSVLKQTEEVDDPRAVNQDKTNMLFSVTCTGVVFSSSNIMVYHCISHFFFQYFDAVGWMMEKGIRSVKKSHWQSPKVRLSDTLGDLD